MGCATCTLNWAVVTEPPDVPHRVCPGGGHDTCGTFNVVNTTVRKRPENCRVRSSAALINRVCVVRVPPGVLSPPAPPGEAHACYGETNATVQNRPEGRDVRLRLTASVAPASFHIASPFVAFPWPLFGTCVVGMQACVACSYHEQGGGGKTLTRDTPVRAWWIRVPRVSCLCCVTYAYTRKHILLVLPRPRPLFSSPPSFPLTPSS